MRGRALTEEDRAWLLGRAAKRRRQALCKAMWSGTHHQNIAVQYLDNPNKPTHRVGGLTLVRTEQP